MVGRKRRGSSALESAPDQGSQLRCKTLFRGSSQKYIVDDLYLGTYLEIEQIGKTMLDSPPHNRPEIIAALKRKLERTLQQSDDTSMRLPLGPPEIDQALGGGLALPGLHEVMGAAAPAFAMMAARQIDGPLAWILPQGRMRRPYPCGLDQAGFSTRNIIFITPHRKDTLWAFEQALKSGAIRAVIAETPPPSFMESRRLQLAAVNGCSLGLLLLTDSDLSRSSKVISGHLSKQKKPASKHSIGNLCEGPLALHRGEREQGEGESLQLRQAMLVPELAPHPPQKNYTPATSPPLPDPSPPLGGEGTLTRNSSSLRRPQCSFFARTDGHAISSAAETRWHIAPLPRSTSNAHPRYRLELLKNKQGSLTHWEVDWHGPAHRFHLAAPSRDRSDLAPST